MDGAGERGLSVLIVSFGPVPTPQHQTVEGGGMRCWGLAQGLRDQRCAVTVGVNVAFPLDVDEVEGVRLVNWSLDDEFANLLNSVDVVVASYCMGDPSVFIAAQLAADVRLVLDLYVPIYVEVAARDSDDLDTEYTNYMADIERFNVVLNRGDYFMCANEAQKLFYTGILASLGVINPRTYRDDRLIVVPFGVDRAEPVAARNPYTDLGLTSDDFVLLWFGGLYPWFKIDTLLAAVGRVGPRNRLKLVIVGGRNPFNPNPDFARQYTAAVSYAQDHDLIDSSVFFVDWVDYGTRAEWYRHADAVISLNTPGDENALSWRTRVIDYVWGELLVLTTGGDPLSELLINRGAAVRLAGLSEDELTESLDEVVAGYRDGALESVRNRLVELKKQFYWDVVVEPLLPLVTSGDRPYQRELDRRGGLTPVPITVAASSTNPAFVVLRKARTAWRIARTKGLSRSFAVALETVRNQLSHRARAAARRTDRRYVFISHPIDNTGAPLVLLDAIEEFSEKFGAAAVQVIFPSALVEHRRRLARLGIRMTKSVDGMGTRFLHTQVPLEFGDFVLLNTLAIYDNYREYVFDLLEHGKLAHAFWFIHEDVDQLSLVGQSVLTPKIRTRITRLAEDGKLTVLTPSQKVSDDFAELFKTSNVRTVPLRVTVDAALTTPRLPHDYDRIDFLLSGSPLDGRKGQFLAVAALAMFDARYRRADPDRYRDFSLTLLAVGDDYVSRQLKAIASSSLGDAFVSLPSVSRDEALAITRRCNANICCSLNESFALYVAEGMQMGHVILRNGTAGCAEQLRDGDNGYFITDDVMQFAAQVERLLNRSNTNEQLAQMGRVSQDIARGFAESSYVEGILDLPSTDHSAPSDTTP